MNIRKEFKTLILPIIKGSPLIIALVLIAFFITRRMVVYTNVIYQADGAIQIDTKDNSVNANILFEERSPTAGHNFLTEVESFKSKTLIEQTLKSLNFKISYYRVGELKTKEIYTEKPFYINFATSSQSAYDRSFFLKYLGENQFHFSKDEKFEGEVLPIQFDSLFVTDQLVMTIKREQLFLEEKPQSLEEGDVFMFRLNSVEGLQEGINASNLFIKPVDKEIQVIKIYYQHEVPEKAKLFVDALMNTYIDLCQNKISKESEKTLEFIDNQLAVISSDLKKAESHLAGFKAENGIINAKQETDATLKEIMQLDLQKVNYTMQEEELKRLFEFLSTGNDLQEFAPNFESLRDAVFRDAYMQAQKLELEKLDLAIKYTEESQEIQNINAKIRNLRTFIHESVNKTLDNITQRRETLEGNIASINESIQTLPNKERQIVVLEREVKLNESLYNLMMEKRMELAISKTASVVGHKIIDPARVSKSPIWPNKGLIYGVAIFFALLIGIGLSFLLNFLFGTIKSKDDLNDNMKTPIIGTVDRVEKPKMNKINAFANLYTNLEILKQKNNKSDKGSLIVVSSQFANDGKTFVSSNIARAFASVGKKVLLIDMDIRKPDIHRVFEIEGNVPGLSGIIKEEVQPNQAIIKTAIKNLDIIPAGSLSNIFSAIIFSPSSLSFLEELKSTYEYIFIDTPPIGVVVDAVPLMHQSDINLMVIRSGSSKVRKISMLEDLIEEFKIPNVYSVLNSVKNTRINYEQYSKQESFKWDFLKTPLNILLRKR